MNRKILPLALAASLLLNGFFIGGYWFARKSANDLAPKENRIEAIAGRLNLTVKQKRIFHKLKKQAWQIRKTYRKQTKRLRNDLMRQLAAGVNQSETSERLMSEMTARQAEYQKKIIVLIKQFLKELNGVQRNTFLKIVSDNKKFSALLSG